LSDIDLLLEAIPGRLILRFFTSLFLYRQALAGSPAVSLSAEQPDLSEAEQRYLHTVQQWSKQEGAYSGLHKN
jgi:hypothetical protein